MLREFAARFRRNTRGIDLACRFGGEEFLVVMPDTDMARPTRSASGCAVHRGGSLPGRRQGGHSYQYGERRGRGTRDCTTTHLRRFSERADRRSIAPSGDGRNRVAANAA